MENSLYNPMNHDQPKHGETTEQLVRASSLNNKDAEDFHDWEASLKKVELELKNLTSWLESSLVDQRKSKMVDKSIPPIFDVYPNDDNDMVNMSPFISSYYEKEEVTENLSMKKTDEHKVFSGIQNTICCSSTW